MPPGKAYSAPPAISEPDMEEREEIPLFLSGFLIILFKRKIFPKFAQLVKILITN